MGTTDVKCPECGTMNYSLYLEDTEGFMECSCCGCTVQLQLDRDTEYTVGCHADVAEDTEIKLMVYDGQRSEVYIPS